MKTSLTIVALILALFATGCSAQAPTTVAPFTAPPVGVTAKADWGTIPNQDKSKTWANNAPVVGNGINWNTNWDIPVVKGDNPW